jgi:hypothetical protein
MNVWLNVYLFWCIYVYGDTDWGKLKEEPKFVIISNPGIYEKI